MKRKTPLVSFLVLIFFISFFSLLCFSPNLVVASDNTARGAPLIRDVDSDDNLVNTGGDNVKISFQVHDDNGWKNIKSVELFIKNKSGGVEKYENLTGKGENISPYDNEYTYIFNPDKDFKVGPPTVEIWAADNEGHENKRIEENLFQVTDENIRVTTENADNVTENSATLHASINLAGFDKVEACFYYQNNIGMRPFENKTIWENTKSSDYRHTVNDLEPNETYEFRGSVQSPKYNQYDNGSVLEFSTWLENASVSTGNVTYENKSNLLEVKPTLNAVIDYGDYDKVDITFFYRKGEESKWISTGWDNNYSSENYTYTFSKSLATDTIYEQYAKIRFGPSDNLTDNGDILTFNTGGVKILASIPPDVQVNNNANITIEVQNGYSDKELRNVVIKAERGRYTDNQERIDSIGPNSTGSTNFTYQSINSGEKTLVFSIEYRVYQDNNFKYSQSKAIKDSIQVTGTEYENAIALRESSENPPFEWIFEGETYTAEIEIHNQRPTQVSGVRVVGENVKDYGVGTLNPNESTTIQIKVPPENYEMGKNEINLRAIHEFGISSQLSLKFKVKSENSPVGVSLVRSNSPIFEGEKLKFTLMVAASPDSEAEDLVIRSLSENVIPRSYWVGEEMKNLAEQEISGEETQQLLGDLSNLPTGGSETEEEEEKRAIIGRTLYFEAKNLKKGDNSLKFEVTYDLGNREVKREFEVGFEIQGTPSLRLIRAEPVGATKGETAIISLEIANEMPAQADAVYVVPLGDHLIAPSSRWIGSMDPNDYLPVDFKVQTENLKDGETLAFQAFYRIGDTRTYKTKPLTVTVHLDEPEKNLFPYYLGGSLVAIVAGVLVFYYWFRR